MVSLDAVVRPGSRVLLGDGCGAPSSLYGPLSEVADGVRLVLGWLPGRTDGLDLGAFADVRVLGGGPGLRRPIEAGLAHVVPCRLSAVPSILASTLRPDLVIAQLVRGPDGLHLLVHAGQFLVERPNFIRTLSEKAAAGVTIRINFGDPASRAVTLRSEEEQLGKGVLAARIRYGLAAYKPLLDTPGIEFRFHKTTLYNSIFRFDEQMIVNAHVYGVPGAHAPALHLRKLGAGDLFDTYATSFVDVWKLSKPATW
jgi:hypothetical protein